MPTYAYCDYIEKKDIISKNFVTDSDEFFYIAESELGKQEDVEEGCEPETIVKLVEKECYELVENMSKKTLMISIKRMMKAASAEKKKVLSEEDLKAWQKKVQDHFLNLVNKEFDDYQYYVKDSEKLVDGCFVIFAKWKPSGDGVYFYYFKDCLYEEKF